MICSISKHTSQQQKQQQQQRQDVAACAQMQSGSLARLLDEQKMFIFNNIPQIIICRRLMHSDEWASLLP